MDDMLYPAYTSAKAKGTTFSFNETGDAMVRELDLSRITLRLVSEINRKGGDDKNDDIKAKIVGSTMETLKRALYKPTQVTLKDAHGHESKITVSMRYLPVKMQLDASESFNNSGNLRVEVLDAADLPAADRNGFSDPYCTFKMDGKEVYKTKVQKKTLHPAWNEFFDVPVRSRTGGKFTVDVFDWDFADSADHLGASSIPLANIEPFTAQEVTLPLDGKSGAVRLKMVFKPDYVTRSRQGSSTFSGTFNAPGKIVGAPVKTVGKGVGLVGGGVSKGAGFLSRGFKKRTTSDGPHDTNGDAAEMRDTSMDVPTGGMAAGGAAVGGAAIGGLAVADATRLGTPGGDDSKALPTTPHQRAPSFGGNSLAPGAEQGTASISVLGVSGFDVDHKIEVHVLQESPRGLSKVIKTDDSKPKGGEIQFKEETKRVTCSAETTFRIQVREHKTFGTGDTLGEAAFFVSRTGQRDITVGPGLVSIRTDFQAADAASTVGSTMDSPASRKGGLGRFGTRRERSVTPSTG